ncbi:23831_t:CDS:2, partial [Cetraspora pellucida]
NETGIEKEESNGIEAEKARRIGVEKDGNDNNDNDKIWNDDDRTEIEEDRNQEIRVKIAEHIGEEKDNVSVSLEEANDADNDNDNDDIDDRKTIVAKEETGNWKKIERLKSLDFRSLEDFDETHLKLCVQQQNDAKRKAIIKISKLALKEMVIILDNRPKTKERIMALE